MGAMFPVRILTTAGATVFTSLAIVTSSTTTSGRATPSATCESLAALVVPNTTMAVAQSVPAGSFTPPSGAPIANLPAFCRVAGSITPSADSDIRFEVWMPASGWNRKL
jgi:feruloyl esterase